MFDYIREFVGEERKGIISKLVTDIETLYELHKDMSLLYGVYLGELKVLTGNVIDFNRALSNVLNPAMFEVFGEAFLKIKIGNIK